MSQLTCKRIRYYRFKNGWMLWNMADAICEGKTIEEIQEEFPTMPSYKSDLAFDGPELWVERELAGYTEEELIHQVDQCGLDVHEFFTEEQIREYVPWCAIDCTEAA